MAEKSFGLKQINMIGVGTPAIESSSDLIFSTNGSERVRILSGGNIGIGLTNPTRNLTVASGASSGYIQLCNDASGTGSTDGFHLKLDSQGLIADIIHRQGGSLRFWTNNTQRVAITSESDGSGNIQIANGNLVFSSSGTGIDFQNAGISSTTATAHILGDYEEGTWTPSFNGYSTNFSGTYTKIGRQVTIKIQRANSIPANTITSGVRITGIPFTPHPGGNDVDLRSQFVSGMLSGRAPGSLGGGTAGAAIAPIAIINESGIDLYEQDTIWTTGFLPQNSNGDWIMPATWQNGSTAIYIMWEFTYQTGD